MAKIVIAGKADCPYYARAELLGDKLSINLPDFKLHKIVIKPEEWQNWLNSTCQERGWAHGKSPLVWRELIDRGGKGVLIGGANEFQEYAKGYYGIESDLKSVDMRKIAGENFQYKIDLDEEEREYKARSKPLHVCITNASSPVCYAMLDAMARGDVFGANTEIVLHLLDAEDKMEYMQGVKMEVMDLAHGLLRDIQLETDVTKAFTDCGAAVLLDSIQRKDLSFEDWIKSNAELFVSYAKAIDSVAKKNVRVLVAGQGPVNFSAYMMIKNAPTVPRQNIVAMSRMVENRAKAVIAERLKVNSAGVVDLIVWGNANGQNMVDVDSCRVHGYDGAIVGPASYSVSGPEMVFDKKWLETEYLELVNSRQQKCEELMNHPASSSQASAVNQNLSHWWNGSPSGQMFSLGVCSEGWYGIEKGVVFSLPVTFHPKGYWNVVQDIDLTDETKQGILATVEDLLKEIDVIYPRPKPPTPPPMMDQEVATEKKAGEKSDEDSTDQEDEKRLETIIEDKAGETTVDKSGDEEQQESSAPEGEKTDAKETEGETTEVPTESEAPKEPETQAEPETSGAGDTDREQLPTE